MTQASDALSETRAEPLVRTFCPRRGGLWIAGALMLLAAFFVWQAALLPFGTFELPGAGFFPLLLAVLLLGFCAAIGADLLTAAPPIEEKVELGHRDVLVAVAAMLAVPIVFESLGAYLTLGLFTAVLLVFVGRVPLIRAVPASALGMVGVWYFFKILLGLQLPGGPFF